MKIKKDKTAEVPQGKYLQLARPRPDILLLSRASEGNLIVEKNFKAAFTLEEPWPEQASDGRGRGGVRGEAYRPPPLAPSQTACDTECIIKETNATQRQVTLSTRGDAQPSHTNQPLPPQRRRSSRPGTPAAPPRWSCPCRRLPLRPNASRHASPHNRFQSNFLPETLESRLGEAALLWRVPWPAAGDTFSSPRSLSTTSRSVCRVTFGGDFSCDY
ncbi:hypothetical protein E2C01_075660 [Portunus trituberculatus]|uniref:Uncharacterized protein n=1 Tax=Portunus trituberculatus TaxID=210409 RepID=A0A5B7I959_PORTR|nr:hypothetical protein [Portunus trituberculatus]